MDVAIGHTNVQNEARFLVRFQEGDVLVALGGAQIVTDELPDLVRVQQGSAFHNGSYIRTQLFRLLKKIANRLKLKSTIPF